jgi:hypothetical protein
MDGAHRVGTTTAVRGLPFAAELDDAATVALGWAVLRQRRELLQRLALGGKLEARRFALFCFAAEGLRHCSGAAHFAEQEYLDLKLAALVSDEEHIADTDFASGLGLDAVRMDAAEFAGFLRQRTGLEEARGPQPFVDAHGGQH